MGVDSCRTFTAPRLASRAERREEEELVEELSFFASRGSAAAELEMAPTKLASDDAPTEAMEDPEASILERILRPILESEVFFTEVTDPGRMASGSNVMSTPLSWLNAADMLMDPDMFMDPDMLLLLSLLLLLLLLLARILRLILLSEERDDEFMTVVTVPGRMASGSARVSNIIDSPDAFILANNLRFMLLAGDMTLLSLTGPRVELCFDDDDDDLRAILESDESLTNDAPG
jgi:hypothetical protein